MTTVSTDRRFGVNSGLAVKAPCVVAATTAITLSGLQTINGVTINEGDRVLVTAQPDGISNGIYDASSAAWTRSVDFDGQYDVTQGTLCIVASYAITGILYSLVTPNPIIIDVSPINFLATDASGYAATASAAAAAALISQTSAAASATIATAQASAALASANAAASSAGSAGASATLAQSYLQPISGSSTTTMTIGLAMGPFTTNTGLLFVPGQPVLLVPTAAPQYGVNATVASYNAATGVMAINVSFVIGGSGLTYSAWSLSLSSSTGIANALNPSLDYQVNRLGVGTGPTGSPGQITAATVVASSGMTAPTFTGALVGNAATSSSAAQASSLAGGVILPSNTTVATQANTVSNTTLATTQFANPATTNGPIGSVTLPGGTIIKWGVVTIVAGTTNGSASFPAAFPVQCYMVTGSLAPTGYYALTAISRTGFSFALGGASPGNLFYIAIGK